MQPTIVYNVYTGLIWDWRVATDLFLGGVGVGAFLLAFVLWRFAAPAYRGLAQTAAVIAPVAVSMGLLLLFWKLGYKMHAYQMGLNFAPTSVMWWGAMIQGLFVALAAVFAFRLLFPTVNILDFLSAERVGWVAAPVALIVGVYHGFLLATVTSHPVWATGAMVMASVTLFAVTGPAAAVLVHSLRRGVGLGVAQEQDVALWPARLRPVAQGLIVGTLLVVVALIAWWADLRFGTIRGREALSALLSHYGMLLGVVGVLLGLLLPAALLGWFGLRRGDGGPSAVVVATACVLILIGGFTVRYTAVLGGQIPPAPATLATLN